MSAQPLPSVVIDESRSVTRDELSGDVAAVAAGLAERGVGAGDRVVVSLPNSYGFVAVHVALDLIGAVTVNLPTAFRREVGQVIRMVDARFTVLGDVDDARAYGDLRDHVVLAGGEPAELRGELGAVAAAAAGPGTKSWLAFTGGSTGTPRAALHTRASRDASAAAMAERYGVGPHDAVLAAAPVGHAIGFCYAVRLACASGSRLVLQRGWDAERAAHVIESEGCTFGAIPTPFLADLVERDTQVPNVLRHLLVGGAPVPSDDLARADTLFGEGVVSAYYGASECGAVLSLPPGSPDDLRLSTDGAPMPGMAVRVVDEQGGEAPPGEQGELHVRGPQVAMGYWMNNDSDRQFLPGGWFATRDLAVRHESGFISLTGRMSEKIIRGAVNVVPREVEEALAGHARVGRAVVLGAPDRRLGERLVAVIVPNGDAPGRDELRAWLKDCGLAHSKWPDDLVVVEELPRTPAGKIDRLRLRDELTARVPPGE